jgi:hypothetical protein
VGLLQREPTFYIALLSPQEITELVEELSGEGHTEQHFRKIEIDELTQQIEGLSETIESDPVASSCRFIEIITTTRREWRFVPESPNGDESNGRGGTWQYVSVERRTPLERHYLYYNGRLRRVKDYPQDDLDTIAEEILGKDNKEDKYPLLIQKAQAARKLRAERWSKRRIRSKLEAEKKRYNRIWGRVYPSIYKNLPDLTLATD